MANHAYLISPHIPNDVAAIQEVVDETLKRFPVLREIHRQTKAEQKSGNGWWVLSHEEGPEVFNGVKFWLNRNSKSFAEAMDEAEEPEDAEIVVVDPKWRNIEFRHGHRFPPYWWLENEFAAAFHQKWESKCFDDGVGWCDPPRSCPTYAEWRRRFYAGMSGSFRRHETQFIRECLQTPEFSDPHWKELLGL